MKFKYSTVVKWLLALQLSIFLIFTNSSEVFARSLELDSVNIEAIIDEAGNMHVTEYDTFTFKGKYNGIFLDLGLKKSDGIVNFEAFELSENQEIPLIFEVETSNDQFHTYKVYSASEDITKTFKFTYTYKNVVQVYEDTAEIYWQFFDSVNTMYINEVNTKIILPSKVNSEQIHAFGHGNLSGTINVDEQGHINFYSSPVEAGQMFEVRVLFPTELVPKSKKVEQIAKLDSILLEEAEAKERDLQAAIPEELPTVIITGWVLLFALLVLGLNIWFARYIRKKYGNIYKSTWTGKYLRELPSDLPPAMVTALVYNHTSTKDIIATLMDLVRKDKIILTKIKGNTVGEDDYEFKLDSKQNIDLYRHEKMLIDWLFGVEDVDSSITIGELKDKASDATYSSKFRKKYSEWQTEIAEYIKKNGYLEERKPGIRRYMLLIMIAQVIIYTNFLPYDYKWTTWMIPFLLLFNLPARQRKTELGQTEFAKWKAFKKYIRDYSKIGDRGPLAVHLWEHYYVYAISLNEAKAMDKISNIDMGSSGKVHFASNNFDYNSYSLLLSTFEKHTSTPSSSSGGGGGFSSGGGRGGGGGGRGGF